MEDGFDPVGVAATALRLARVMMRAVICLFLVLLETLYVGDCGNVQQKRTMEALGRSKVEDCAAIL